MWFSVVVLLVPILSSSLGTIFSSDYAANPGNQNEVDGVQTRNFATAKYTEQERNAIKLFRERVSDVLKNDFEHTEQFLIRWIRACSMDLRAAEEMLRKFLQILGICCRCPIPSLIGHMYEAQQWRKENNIDNILNEEVFESKIELCPLQGNGYDGSPILVVNAAKTHDMRRIMMAGLQSNLTRKLIHCLEKAVLQLRKLSQESGKDIGQGIVIVNLEGYNLKMHACARCVSMYLDFLISAQNYYPEYLKLSVAVNAPKIVKPLYELAKPLMHSSTLRAIKIFGVDKKEYSTFLLKYIPPEQLSRTYGGSADW